MLDQSANPLLSSLSSKNGAYLISRMKPVTLEAREVLYEPDETPKFAHFLTSGIASIVGMMSSGACAEVGIWGKEGLVECFHLLGNARIPTRCFMQIGGTALRIPFKELQKEFQENPGAPRVHSAGRSEPGSHPRPACRLQPSARGRRAAGALVPDGARPHRQRHVLPDPGVSRRHAGIAENHGYGGGRHCCSARA